MGLTGKVHEIFANVVISDGSPAQETLKLSESTGVISGHLVADGPVDITVKVRNTTVAVVPDFATPVDLFGDEQPNVMSLSASGAKPQVLVLPAFEEYEFTADTPSTEDVTVSFLLYTDNKGV